MAAPKNKSKRTTPDAAGGNCGGKRLKGKGAAAKQVDTIEACNVSTGAGAGVPTLRQKVFTNI